MLSGRLALITGGGSGIGLETAKLFAKNDAVVILADLNESINNVVNELQKPSNSSLEHSSFKCDVSSLDQVNQLFKFIADKYPAQKVPNIIVNSAGIYTYGPFSEISEETFDKLLDVNLKGTLLVSQTACKLLVENFNNVHLEERDTYASIVNIGSIAGKRALPGGVHYSASKAAVESLSRSIAKDMGKYKIRCNTVAPGFIRTPLIANTGFDAIEHSYVSSLALNRIGHPEEVANVCLFLASNLSSYVTGSMIDISGGSSC